MQHIGQTHTHKKEMEVRPSRQLYFKNKQLYTMDPVSKLYSPVEGITYAHGIIVANRKKYSIQKSKHRVEDFLPIWSIERDNKSYMYERDFVDLFIEYDEEDKNRQTYSVIDKGILCGTQTKLPEIQKFLFHKNKCTLESNCFFIQLKDVHGSFKVNEEEYAPFINDDTYEVMFFHKMGCSQIYTFDNNLNPHVFNPLKLWGFFKAPTIEGTEVVFDTGSFTM